MMAHFRWFAVLALAGALLGGCKSRTPGDTAAVAAYKKHRLATWTIDKDTRAAAGFAHGEIGPGESLTLTPTPGYALAVTLGQLTTQEITYDHRTWQKETALDVKTSHGTGSTQGSINLVEPRFHVEYGLNEKLQSITLLVPTGSLRATRLAVPEKFRGDLAELEDLILGAAEDSYIDVGQAAELYGILGKTVRLDRWRSLSTSRDVGIADAATTVLAKLADPDGTKKFSDLCLKTGGNRQIPLLEAISEMPQSDLMLDTIVKLILTPGDYLLKMPPGVAAADMDRRYGLFQALLKYPPEKLKPHAADLVAWAKTHKFDRWAKAIEDRIAGK